MTFLVIVVIRKDISSFNNYCRTQLIYIHFEYGCADTSFMFLVPSLFQKLIESFLVK